MTAFFYNGNGIGDVLIIDLLKEHVNEIKVEKKNDLAIIQDSDTNNVLGYNLFNASGYFNDIANVNGKWKPAQEDVDQLNNLIKEAGFELLSSDARPDFIIGQVEGKESHPDADKLSVCQVNLGDEQVQIVCGAPNVEAGQKVVVARVGTMMPDGTVIKDAELRGVPSSGMICSARELRLPNAPQKKGILVLEDDAPLGQSFWTYNEER